MKSLSAPRNLPVGVRTAETMTASRMLSVLDATLTGSTRDGRARCCRAEHDVARALIESLGEPSECSVDALTRLDGRRASERRSPPAPRERRRAGDDGAGRRRRRTRSDAAMAERGRARQATARLAARAWQPGRAPQQLRSRTPAAGRLELGDSRSACTRSRIIAVVRLVLASASPRRAELLAAAGFAFDVVAGRRRRDAAAGRGAARRTSRGWPRTKADARGARRPMPDAVVLGADTVVVVDGAVAGQAGRRRRRRARCCARLSGRVARGADRRRRRAAGGRRRSQVERDHAVRFAALTEPRSHWYVATRRAVRQGRRLRHPGPGVAVHRRASTGPTSNVVGLPVATVYRLLAQAGPGLRRGSMPLTVSSGERYSERLRSRLDRGRAEP